MFDAMPRVLSLKLNKWTRPLKPSSEVWKSDKDILATKITRYLP